MTCFYFMHHVAPSLLPFCPFSAWNFCLGFFDICMPFPFFTPPSSYFPGCHHVRRLILVPDSVQRIYPNSVSACLSKFCLDCCQFLGLMTIHQRGIHHVSIKHPQSMLFINVRDVSHPYKTSGRIMVLHILPFTFLDRRHEDKRLWTEW
jgi:hypothetical protein